MFQENLLSNSLMKVVNESLTIRAAFTDRSIQTKYVNVFVDRHCIIKKEERLVQLKTCRCHQT